MDITTVLAAIFTPEVTTAIVQALAGIIASIIGLVLTAGYRLIKSRATAEQFAFIQSVAVMAVQAAEQMGAAGYIEDKKGVAIGIVVRELELRGIKVDPTAVDTAIEAAVMEAINQFKAAKDEPEAEVKADIAQPFYGGYGFVPGDLT